MAGDTAGTLRLHEFDVAKVNDTVNDNGHLVTGRDQASGADRDFVKTEVADLPTSKDPQNLAGFGPSFRFPFVTFEDVLALDADTILVVDDNYPGTGGRGADVKDPGEFLILKLGAPLTPGTGIGRRERGPPALPAR